MVGQTVTDCVSDCSVALKWELPNEPFADEAMELFEDWRAGVVRMFAPTVLPAEIASALLRAARKGRIPFPNALDSMRNLVALPFTLVDITPLLERAFDVARQFQQGLFDCLYVALAEGRGIEFWTGDQRLFNALRSPFPFVRWIGDYTKRR